MRMSRFFVKECKHLELAFLALLFFAVGCSTKPVCVLYGHGVSLGTQYFQGEWVGLTDVDYSFYRLSLTNGTGELVAAYSGDTVQFRITEWFCASNNILECQFSASTNLFDPLSLKCEVNRHGLNGVLQSHGGASEKIAFWRKNKLLENLSRLGIGSWPDHGTNRPSER